MPSPLLPAALAVVALVFLARQLRRPSGWFGRRVMASFLNDGNRDLLDSCVDAVAARPGERVVDVGFGGGYALDRLAPLVRPERAVGVEVSDAMIAVVRERAGGSHDLHRADAAALPFPDGSFDAVLCVNTIYFWPEPDRVLREMHRVLRPGGRLVLGYRAGALFRLNPLTWLGFRVHGDRAVARLVEGAGFAVEIRAPRSGERIAVGARR